MRAGGCRKRVGLFGRRRSLGVGRSGRSAGRLNARTKRSKSPHARRIVEAHTAWLDEVERELG